MLTNVWRKTHIAEILLVLVLVLVLENKPKNENENENEDDLKNASYQSF